MKDEGRGGNGKGQRFREGKGRRMKDEEDEVFLTFKLLNL